MKKLISCLLAVLLVCSLMSMNVFADTYPIVGDKNQGINGGVDDSFSPTRPSAGNGQHDITVNFGQDRVVIDPETGEEVIIPGGTGETIIHRYAVDVTYGSFLLDLTDLGLEGKEDTNNDGKIDSDDDTVPYYMVWDVQTHKYVLCYEDVNAEGDTVYEDATLADGNDNDIADILETPVTLPGYVTITNHSDLTVGTTVQVEADNSVTQTSIKWEIGEQAAATADREDTSGITYSNNNTVVEQVIGKAKAGINGADGEETNGTTYKFIATPTDATGWLGVIGNFINNPVTTIGKITVTISK